MRFAFALFAFVLFVGCESSTLSNNDCLEECPGGEICLEGTCSKLCNNDVDCAGTGLFCVREVCAPANDACGGCAAGDTCFESECRASCATSCENVDEICTQNVCLPTGGECEGSTCLADELCLGGACSTVCSGNGDCANPDVCVDGVCLAPSNGTCGEVTCEAAEVCVADVCAAVCTDGSECETNEICVSDLCQALPEDDAPIITSINGDGTPDGAADHTDNHIQRQLTIVGEHLLDTRVELIQIGGSVQALEICTSSDTQVVVALPDDVVAGEYTLRVVGQAGTCSSAVSVLQGEIGPEGPIGPPGVPCVGCIDTETFNSAVYGSSGSADTIARSDHGHSLSELPSVGTAINERLYNTYGIPWANGITYDPATDHLFYLQHNSWTVGRINMISGHDSLVWYDGGGNFGQGVVVVERPATGARELWWSTSNWGNIRYQNMNTLPVDPTTASTQDGDYTFACGGFAGLSNAEAFSGIPDTYLSVRSDSATLRYWVFGSGSCLNVPLSTAAGAESTDLNTAMVNRVNDGRTAGIGPHGFYHDPGSSSIWITDSNNNTVWIMTYDPGILSSAGVPLVNYAGRLRTGTKSPRGLAYDAGRKLLWTCSHPENECSSRRFDIDTFLASTP